MRDYFQCENKMSVDTCAIRENIKKRKKTFKNILCKSESQYINLTGENHTLVSFLK